MLHCIYHTFHRLEPLTVFSTEEIKETWKYNFCNKHVEIGVHSKIDDGLHVILISQVTCSDTIHTGSVYSYLNKACPFEGISKQLATVQFHYLDIFHDRYKTGLTLFIHVYVIKKTKQHMKYVTKSVMRSTAEYPYSLSILDVVRQQVAW